MMMNNVVKSSELSQLFCDFNSIIQSDIVNMLCRKRKKDFTRNRNMNFYSVIYYFIFRNKTTTNAELTHFYSSIDKFEKRISKQALNKAIKKLNPNVFTYLINQFASIYYASSLPKKYRDHLLIAEDGTYMEIPYNVYNINDFQFCMNQHVHDIFDVKKVQSKAGGLYDVTNGFFIDFSLKPAPYSETPLAFAHLYRTKKILKIKKSFILQIDIMVQLKSYLIWSFLNITMLLEENLIFIKNRLLSCNLMMNGLKLKSMINGLKDSDFH